MLRNLTSKKNSDLREKRKNIPGEHFCDLHSRVFRDSGNDLDEDCSKPFESEGPSEQETFSSFTNLSTNVSSNLLVAPKELTKLFHSRQEKNAKKTESGLLSVGDEEEEENMEYFHNTDSGSSMSDDIFQDHIYNKELMMSKLTQGRIDRASPLCFKHRMQNEDKFNNDLNNDLDENSNHETLKLIKEKSINVDLWKPKLSQNVEEQESRNTVINKSFKTPTSSIDENINEAHVVSDKNNNGEGDFFREELEQLLTYPVHLENLNIPKKRELHRLIHHRLCNYINPDIMLIIDEHEFFCHRIVLQSYSKFFDNINNLEDDDVITINEAGVTKQAFIAVYGWMVSLNENGLKYISRENFVEVLIASQVLQIRDLEEQCLALIDSKHVFYEGHAYQLFKHASKLEETAIKELMVPRIQQFFLPLVSSPEYVELSLEDVCAFLSSSYIVVHSEIEVFMSAARWLLHNWPVRKQYLPKVMNCVRFGLMNPLELVDIRKNPESPEFQRITEDTTIQKYIDDGLAYSTYCTMKGGTEDLNYHCQLFGLEIPQPRNWADSSKSYKSYGEFLNYLKQIRTNSLKIIEGMHNQSLACSKPSAYSSNINDTFLLDYDCPLKTAEGIPSMSNLLSANLNYKERRNKPKTILKSNLNNMPFKNPQNTEDSFLARSNTSNSKQKASIGKNARKEPSLKCKAATIIQAVYRGYRVRMKYNLKSKSKEMKCQEAEKKRNKPTAQAIFDSRPEKDHHCNKYIQNKSPLINFVMNNRRQDFSQKLLLNSPTLFLFGGLNPQEEMSQCNDGRSVYRYSLDMSKWEKVSSLPRGRYYHNAVFLKGKMYILGGVDPQLEEQKQPCICSEMWSFNPSSGEWFIETNTKTPRRNFGLVAFQGYLYAIGGQGLSDEILNSVEKYDPIKKVWGEVCSLPEPLLSPAVARLGRSIWVAGGMRSTSKAPMSTHVYSFEPRQNMWIVKPPLPIGKAFSTLLCYDEKLFLVGGAEKRKEWGYSASSSSIEVYDPQKNKWEFFLDIHTPRHSHTSVIIGKCLFIIGGITTRQMKSLSDIEIWSLESKTWKEQMLSLPTVLNGHATVAVLMG